VIQVVFNSFPRSGNVYQGSISGNFFNSIVSTVHMPEIFSVKELYNVTIFRKPEDAIASLVMRNSSMSNTIEEMPGKNCEEHIDMYRKYFQYAKTNKDIIYIGKFDNLITNTVKHFEDIAKYFDIPMENNYRDSFKNAELSGSLWDNRYDGHMPRPKDPFRLEIEKNVRSLRSIQELNQEYENFINDYATVV
jgi:hypothetical protein